MKAERVILSFLALLIGIGIAGGVFYLYQMTKVIPEEDKNTPPITLPSPTPSSEDELLLVDKPADEEVVEKSPIIVSGKSESDAIVIVRSESSEQVVTPARDGKFTLTFPIAQGENIIQILAIYPDGTEKSILRTVTFSTEEF